MSSTGAADQFRLPTNVKPIHYDLLIKTDLEKSTFQGIVKVDLEIRNESSFITINTLQLEITDASIKINVLPFAAIKSFSTNEDRTTFHLPFTVPSGLKAQLKISFSGDLNVGFTGYYRASFEREGKLYKYAVTQLAATCARRLFPCWDEPLLKATYAITMVSRQSTMNLSNMPPISEHIIHPESPDVSSDVAGIISSSDTEAWKVTKFETTPPMPTYIVALANGQFEYIERCVVMPLSGKTIPIGIYSTSNVHQANFVMDVTKAVLPLYEKIFDVEYPLPKLDTLICDKQGAMENWGLIIGTSNAYLVDANADIPSKKLAASYQSHEIAHMWFGNSTTMEWWDCLYLNEGFATLMGEMIIADKVFPEWRVESEFINGHMSRAMNLDSKLSSHPVEVECPNANDIIQIFDDLSYSKAASVLRMLLHYVGEDKFLEGVSMYLKEHRFGSTITRDLWDGITAATLYDVAEFMDNWITKVGFPLLTVTEHDTGITVRQDRFIESGKVKPEDNEVIWKVPMNIVSKNPVSASILAQGILLEERETDITLDLSVPYKLNAGTKGFYRVLYCPERLVKIAKEATKVDSIFSMDDRIGILNDALALSRAGLSTLSLTLSVVDLWKNEKEYIVWKGIAAGLNELTDTWWEYCTITTKLQTFSRSLFVPLIEKLGYDYHVDESADTSLLRTLSIEQALLAGDEGVICELRERFKKSRDNPDLGDLRSAIYTAAVKYGGREEYDAMREIYNNPQTPADRLASVRALCSAQDKLLIKETLVFVSCKTRNQDVLQFFIALAKNNKAKRLLTNYVEDEYDAILRRFEGTYYLRDLLLNSINFYSSNHDLEAVERFYSTKDTSSYRLYYTQAIDNIRARIAYVQRSTDDMEKWLSAHF